MLKPLVNLGLKAFTTMRPSGKPLLLTGLGSAARLTALIRASGHTRPLLVTDKALLDLGLLDDLLNRFEDEGWELAVFDGVVPNPTYAVIEEGIRVCEENDCDSVVVVGGGSAIDAAKVIAACCSNRVGVEGVVGLLKVKQPTLPFYVVPTTSGTGSEVTSFAVISETETHQKKFVVDPKLIPSAAALDASLIRSLPPHITAATGMDALTHAIESYTSLNRFRDAERDAELAIKLLLEHLPTAYAEGDDVEAREMVALASFLAGYAFNKSGLGYVHAISHQISAHYNTPHGLANAVLLPKVLRFNEPAVTGRLANLERMLGGATKESEERLADRFIGRVEQLAHELRIPRGLKEVRPEDYDAIATNARKEAYSFYAVPRPMNQSQCKALLEDLAVESHEEGHVGAQPDAVGDRPQRQLSAAAV